MSGNCKIILVVDDDAAIRDLLRWAVEMETNIEVLLAENGREALRLLAGRLPALVVTDVRMPVMDGVELIRSIRACPATSDLPIIVVSASPRRRAEALAAGADDYLDKPMDLNAFSAKVRAHLAVDSPSD